MSVQESTATGSRVLREHEEPENSSFSNLLCVWSIGFLAAIEGTISVPSLWAYVQSLGGTHHIYGLCIAVFAIGRLASMGAFGIWVNRRPFKEVLVVSLLCSMISGILYAWGPTFGLWSVVVGRGILGAMSSSTVATQTYVSKHTRPADRTKYMSINVLVTNTLTVAGPAFNLIIVMLPRFSIQVGSLTFYFDNFTWVGYFLCAFQILLVMVVVFVFVEPQEQNSTRAAAPPSTWLIRAATLGDLFPWPRVFLDRWLHKTRAWILLVNNFRNVFTAFAVNYAVPIIADRDYGFGQLQTSYIFLGDGFG